MTQLRKMMLDELERRNYSQNTVRAYVNGLGVLVRDVKVTGSNLEPQIGERGKQ